MLPLQIEKEPPRRETRPPQAALARSLRSRCRAARAASGVVTLPRPQCRHHALGRARGHQPAAARRRAGLEAALVEARFENRAIDIRTGQPRIAQPTAGQFLDRLS